MDIFEIVNKSGESQKIEAMTPDKAVMEYKDKVNKDGKVYKVAHSQANIIVKLNNRKWYYRLTK